jgi:hypothetical protein
MGCGSSKTYEEDNNNEIRIGEPANQNTKTKVSNGIANQTDKSIENEIKPNKGAEAGDNGTNKKTDKQEPKKLPAKYTIVIENSEPQKLDPTECFYIEDRNPKPRALTVKKTDEEAKKIIRMPTFDVVLTEKIKNGEGFDAIINDARFNEMLAKKKSS